MALAGWRGGIFFFLSSVKLWAENCRVRANEPDQTVPSGNRRRDGNRVTGSARFLYCVSNSRLGKAVELLHVYKRNYKSLATSVISFVPAK
jgi:hypothetical protein